MEQPGGSSSSHRFHNNVLEQSFINFVFNLLRFLIGRPCINTDEIDHYPCKNRPCRLLPSLNHLTNWKPRFKHVLKALQPKNEKRCLLVQLPCQPSGFMKTLQFLFNWTDRQTYLMSGSFKPDEMLIIFVSDESQLCVSYDHATSVVIADGDMDIVWDSNITCIDTNADIMSLEELVVKRVASKPTKQSVDNLLCEGSYWALEKLNEELLTAQELKAKKYMNTVRFQKKLNDWGGEYVNTQEPRSPPALTSNPNIEVITVENS